MSGPNLAAATLLFALQLYMDFSGCCDIVLGAARILGYDLIEKLPVPLWRHQLCRFLAAVAYQHDRLVPGTMSISRWAGSRCGAVRHLFNILVVFLVSGLWHGADWRYLMWGALPAGVISVLAVLTRRPRGVIARYNPLYRIDGVRRGSSAASSICCSA